MGTYTNANTLTSLNTMFKYVQDKAQSLLPENAVLMKMVPEVTSNTEEGRKYLLPVQLSHENGITFGDGTVFALNNASSAVYSEVSVDSYPMVLLTQISESVAGRMANSEKSFITESTMRAEVMMNSLARYYEMSMLYGQSTNGIGTSIQTTSTASGTTGTCYVTVAQWSPGIWAGAVGMQVNFYDGTGALVSSSTDSVFTVTSVSASTKSFALSGSSTGITALSTAFGSYSCVIVINGAGGTSAVNGNIMLGLEAQIVGAATIFGISASTYSLWQGQSYSASSASLTMGKVLAGVGLAVGMGGLNSELALMVGAATFQNLNSDQAALRQYDGSYKSGKESDNGFEDLVYHGPNGKIVVYVNNVVKDGEAYAIPKKFVKRVGVHEISFKRPGKDDEFFQEIPGYAGYSLRASGDFCVLCERLAQCVKFTSIVNS
jgi:hypothetical protein